MIDIQNNPVTWDLEIVDGDLALVSAGDCAAQHVAQRLKTFRGEWYLNLDSGVPWFQDILRKNPNPELVDGILKSTIYDSPDIVELLAFDMDFNQAQRTLTVTFSAQASNGDIVTNSIDIGV